MLINKNLFVLLMFTTVSMGVYGACPTKLHYAVSIGDKSKALELIASGFSLNEKSKNGYTPLHFAAAYGHLELAQLLIDHNAKVNEKSNSGNTPLHAAAEKGHYSVAQFLLAHGASSVEKNMASPSHTPAQLAAKKGHNELVFLFTHWDDLAEAIRVLWCQSFLAAHHPRCGTKSQLKALPYLAMESILSFLEPGDCFYCHEEVRRYVQPANNGICSIC